MRVIITAFFLLSRLALRTCAWQTCTVPISNSTVDSSPDISTTFASCSRDSTIVFSRGATYPIGSVLSLTSLNNVRIELLGTLRYSDDLRYWITHGIYQPFQNVSIGLEIGGHNITIDGGGTGVIDGQGQIWYDYANGYSQYFGRPIPFSLRRASNTTAKNFEIRNSQYWSFLISNSSDIEVDNVVVNCTSQTQPDAYPGNLGNVNINTVNTDGFDTLYSDNVRILNSYVRNGDDCVAIKPNSTNILVQNVTCERSSGFAIGSLGQYEGVFDLAENITIKDSIMRGSSNGAWMKTWSGAKTSFVYPPNGGGNGTGLIKNVLYQNITMFNVSTPITVSMCNSYSQYTPDLPCEDTPTSFRIENVTWDGITVEQGTGRIVDLECKGETGCNGMTVANVKVVGRNFTDAEEETWACVGVNGVSEGCSGLFNFTSSVGS